MRKLINIFQIVIITILLSHSVYAGSKSDLQLGIAEAKKGNLLEARKLFESYLESYPNSGRALRGLGNTYLLIENDVEKALEYYRLAWNVGDVESLAQMTALYLSYKEKYDDELNKIEDDLRLNSSKNHQVAMALMALADKKNDKELFLHAYSSIKVRNFEKPDNVKAVVYLLKKFGFDDRVGEFEENIRKVHGSKFDEVLSSH